MTDAILLDGDPPRVIVQFLEGGAASGAIGPDAAVTRLREAADRLPLRDVCLGWALPLALIQRVAAEARGRGARVWLWHPLLSGDGRHVPGLDAALGPAGRAVSPPGGMGEFAFDCPVRPSASAGALARLDGALARFDWDGVFLDKIRWPSPTGDPAAELACFCDACRAAAASRGMDLDAVAAALDEAAATVEGRLGLVAGLLGLTGARPGPIDEFLDWRCERVTATVSTATELARSRRGPDGQPLRVALDVFAPSLARSVGQDLASLAPLGEFTKAMLYLGTHGPAGLSYELCRLTRWLSDGGLDGPAARIAELLGYPLPDEQDLCRAVLGPAAFDVELARLREQAGVAAAAGIDAVRITGLAVVDDATLAHAVRAATAAGVAIVLSWDLWSIPLERLDMIAQAMATATAAGVGA